MKRNLNATTALAPHESASRTSRSGGQRRLTRVPPVEPGDYVQLKLFPEPDGSKVAGSIRRVRSLTCAITQRGGEAIWRVHFDNGRSVEWHLVERLVSQTEVCNGGNDAVNSRWGG